VPLENISDAWQRTELAGKRTVIVPWKQRVMVKNINSCQKESKGCFSLFIELYLNQFNRGHSEVPEQPLVG